MTLGDWKCTECGYEMTIPIYMPIYCCPKCKAEYELVKTIQPHICHSVPIMRLKKSGKLNVTGFFAFVAGPNEKDLKEYLELLKNIEKK